MKKIFTLLATLFLGLSLASCNSSKKVEVTASILHDTKYDSAEVSLTQNQFEKYGFKLGDSCDVTFSNGLKINDIPYFNGYYVKNGAPLIVAYPGFTNIRVTYNNLGIWTSEHLTEDMTVNIKLNKHGKYSPIQDSLGQIYSFKREDYSSDVEFCNFRSLTGGNIKENFLFRGASPVDNSRNRAPYTDRLIQEKQVKAVLDLADTTEDMLGYLSEATFSSNYTKGLYESNRVALLGMDAAYQSVNFKTKLVSGIKQIIATEGPIYIHCMEGKDRTGFVCMLFEALAGATYEEMCNDYMLTYKNYYRVSKENTLDKYNAIKELYFDAFVSFLHNSEDINVLKNASYVEDAKSYLKEGGLTDSEVEQFRQLISK